MVRSLIRGLGLTLGIYKEKPPEPPKPKTIPIPICPDCKTQCVKGWALSSGTEIGVWMCACRRGKALAKTMSYAASGLLDRATNTGPR